MISTSFVYHKLPYFSGIGTRLFNLFKFEVPYSSVRSFELIMFAVGCSTYNRKVFFLAIVDKRPGNLVYCLGERLK